MTKGFLPTSGGAQKKEYTEMQTDLLKRIAEFGEPPLEAARNVGYVDPRSAVKALRKEIIDIAEQMLAESSVEAVQKVKDILNAVDAIPQVDAKLKAAQMILDRTNPKTDKVEMTGEMRTGIFILPDKRRAEE